MKKQLEKKGKKIPIMDLLLASIVIANKMTLLTRDKHFEGIDGLDVIIL